MKTNTILDDIVAVKQREVALLYEQHALGSFNLDGVQRGFCDALKQGGLSLISEVKKASPSRGVIRPDFDPVMIAQEFESYGATTLSVLTDKPYFQGDDGYLAQIRDKVQLPLLRKEFIIDAIQIEQSKALGADAILLIKAILTTEKCQQLLTKGHECGLDVLIEIHSLEELEAISDLRHVQMIGVNNRNLHDFTVSIERAKSLLPEIRKRWSDVVVVAESGYENRQDLEVLADVGFDAVLIGEGLAKSPDLIQYFS